MFARMYINVDILTFQALGCLSAVSLSLVHILLL